MATIEELSAQVTQLRGGKWNICGVRSPVRESMLWLRLPLAITCSNTAEKR